MAIAYTDTPVKKAKKSGSKPKKTQETKNDGRDKTDISENTDRKEA